ncbi:VOC family protein [Paracoccus mutanolyticus]|uniref:VOC family protein n=1 Tax=Paracoccus mutanolyticus TaxID=1499308 RepID=A0ABN5M3R7_9RHOB|nr:VOC family protein [Paracoccus mutanolyticus]AWX92493.1 VOC family protein [Paracoccus mutanolyticus]
MKRERVTLITLGVQDLDRSRRFYADWGWQAHPASQPGLVLFQMTGAALALFQRGELAHDQGRPEAELGTGALTLAQNCADDAEADAVFAAALAAGARAIKPPEKAVWGGYSGYLADPDGHVWEIACNPFWPLDAGGALTLPG